MSKVSVVIPAYNTEKYIEQAFDSIIGPTFTDWECIVVDDVSTDETKKIIEEYAAREPRIRYKTLEHNTGAAKVPRDIAISMANSDWIIMLDSDDELAPDVVEKLLSRQVETGADIVCPKMVFTDENGNITDISVPRVDFDFSQIMTGLQAAKLTIGGWKIGMAGTLIAKKIYDGRHIIKNYMNADEYDSRQMLIAADMVVFVDAHYRYRYVATSITKSFSIKLFDTLYVDKLLQELIEATYGNDDDITKTMRSTRFYGIMRCRSLYLRNRNKLSEKERSLVNSLIKENYIDMSKRGLWFVFSMSGVKSVVKNFCFGANYTLFLGFTYIYSKLKK